MKNITTKKYSYYRIATDHWYNERMVYLLGGALVFIGIVLGEIFHPAWRYFSGFVGIMFMNFALSGYCPMAIILDKCGISRH